MIFVINITYFVANITLYQHLLLLEGVNSAKQKALESDDEGFYGYNSNETSNKNFDEDTCEIEVKYLRRRRQCGRI